MNEQMPSGCSGTWLTDHRQTTWRDLLDLRKVLRVCVDVKFGKLEGRMNQRMDAIEERMAVLEEKIDTVLTLLTQ